jgi:ATP-binding cassette, subfamily B, bacterial
MSNPASSRHRYNQFVDDYKHRRLDALLEAEKNPPPASEPAVVATEPRKTWRERLPWKKGKRREYLREYVQWLRPHRYSIAAVFVFALIVAGLEMISPLFMRFIIDHVLLNKTLDITTRLIRLNLAGGIFLAAVILTSLLGVAKEYRQRLLNIRVILALRRSIFDRLLHLPLPRLWEMKTGGILSRLTGDVETTTGLLQMAIISPSLSVVRLAIGIGVLMSLNWRLALMAMAVIPGAMFISLTATRRIRPIYRSVRKDSEIVDGRVGETFSGIRVVRAFTREAHEILDYMRGRHTMLRKEMFAYRRELVIWTSWGCSPRA